MLNDSSLALPFANHVALGKLLYLSEHELSKLQKYGSLLLSQEFCVDDTTHLGHVAVCLIDFNLINR